VAHAVLEHYPHTYGEQLGIHSLETPSELFKLLVMALLMSARIRAGVAFDAAEALFARGWTTARTMANSSWTERVQTLNQAGYARYDERTATMLADTATLSCSIATAVTSGACAPRRGPTPKSNARCSRTARASATWGSTSSFGKPNGPGPSCSPSLTPEPCRPRNASASAPTAQRY